MVVNKVLKILNEKEWGYLFLLGNKVINVNPIHKKELIVLDNNEISIVKRLLERNNHIDFSSSWVKYIKLISNYTIDYLNEEHYYKYEDRGWTLYIYDDCYVVSVFLDNYDVEQPFEVTIPCDAIADDDFRELKRICDNGID